MAYATPVWARFMRALRAEIEADDLTESEAMALATPVMLTNQREVFRLPAP